VRNGSGRTNTSYGALLIPRYPLLIASEASDGGHLEPRPEHCHAQGVRLFVHNIATAGSGELAVSLGADSLLINAGSHDDKRRTAPIALANVLHTLAQPAMLDCCVGANF